MLEKEVIINRNKIRYAEKQGGNDTVFIFLHGWGSDYTIFSPLYEVLDTVLAFDFPGWGGSPEPEEIWDLDAYTNLAEAFIHKKAGDKKIVFIAHSFGGRVLLKMLSHHAIENIQQILCIGVPFIRKHSVWYSFLQRCSKIAGIGLSYLPEQPSLKIKQVLHRAIGADDYGALKSDKMKKTFQNILNEEVANYCDTLKNYKTDFIWGENDTTTPFSDAVPIVGKTGARLHIIKDGDHFPFRGKTEQAFMETFKKIIQV